MGMTEMCDGFNVSEHNSLTVQGNDDGESKEIMI